MAGPIPVFSFVFAAYAATCAGKTRASEPCASTALTPEAPFRAVWRSHSTLGGALFAKIRVVKGRGSLDPQLAVNSSDETGDGIWVSGIVESGLGFVGAPVAGMRGSAAAKKQIRFHGINVLAWRIANCPTPCERPAAFCGSPVSDAPISDAAF